MKKEDKSEVTGRWAELVNGYVDHKTGQRDDDPVVKLPNNVRKSGYTFVKRDLPKSFNEATEELFPGLDAEELSQTLPFLGTDDVKALKKRTKQIWQGKINEQNSSGPK